MRLIVAVLLFMPILAFAQDAIPLSEAQRPLNYYLTLYSSADDSRAVCHEDFFAFVERMESKRSSFRDENDFIHHVFVKGHQKFLRNFSSYASFGELFGKGNYNCLTGTAMYALLLDHFNIDYNIIETNYHIFLVANTIKGKILLEATDPVNGFTSEPGEIEKRISGYRQNEIQEVNPSKNYHLFSFDLYNEVKLDELLGLMHYNLAIVNYNELQLQSAIAHLDKALELYNSPRIEEFTRVILLTVAESTLDTSMKEFYVKKLQSIRKKRIMMAATAKAN